MKWLLLLFGLAVAAMAQNPVQIIPTTVDPTGQTCNSTRLNERTPNGTLYSCQNGVMAQIGGGGGGVTPYVVPSFTGSPQTVAAATHKQGADALALCWFSTAPDVAMNCGSQNSNPGASGDVTFSYASTPTRAIIYTPGGAGVTGPAGPTGPAGAGGSVFTGSTASTVASSASPVFSLADVSVKSPIEFNISPVVNVTSPTITNLSAGARGLIRITTDGTHTWTWNTIIADGICPVYTDAAATTVAKFVVDPDGSTIHGDGCQTTISGVVAIGAAVSNPSVTPTTSGNQDCRLNASGIACLGSDAVLRVMAPQPMSIDLTGQTAAISSAALFTPSSTGFYRVSYTSKVTTAGSVSSVLGGTTGFVLAYTDGGDSVAQTLTLTASNQSGALITIGTGNTTNSTGTISYGSAIVFAKTGVAMTYSFGYTAAASASMAYEIHVRVESL